MRASNRANSRPGQRWQEGGRRYAKLESACRNSSNLSTPRRSGKRRRAPPTPPPHAVAGSDSTVTAYHGLACRRGSKPKPNTRTSSRDRRTRALAPLEPLRARTGRTGEQPNGHGVDCPGPRTPQAAGSRSSTAAARRRRYTRDLPCRGRNPSREPEVPVPAPAPRTGSATSGHEMVRRPYCGWSASTVPRCANRGRASTPRAGEDASTVPRENCDPCGARRRPPGNRAQSPLCSASRHASGRATG